MPPTESLWTRIHAFGRQLAASLQVATERIDHLLAAARCFGKRGWPLSPDLDSAELAWLVDEVPPDETHEAFVALYDADDGKRIRQVLQDLSGSDRMSTWHPLICQTQRALDDELHALLVPALLTVLEGMVFREPTGETNVKNRVTCIRESQTDLFQQLVWQTIDDFVSELYSHSNFQSEEPHFNRHWILHGRAPATWERKDAIRLLHGIHTIHLALTPPA